MASMRCVAVAVILSSVAFSQDAGRDDIALASKSPMQLARYIESHKVFDWVALASALGIPPPGQYDFRCGAAVVENPCSTQVVNVLNPDQAVLIVQGELLSLRDVYLRYVRKPNGEWQFSGERTAFVKEYPRRHEVTRLGGRPFLKIASDHSQIGFALMQEVEDWFDLTQPGFEPVFSFTPRGSNEPFAFAVGREVTAQSVYHQVAGVETIDLILNVQFNGPGLDVPATYTGVYDRPAGEKKFSLRTAYSGWDRKASIPLKDFEDLAGFEDGPSNERLVTYAFSGLQKIASGSDHEARDWLRFVLEHVGDTPEKRALLELLAKH
jgi:hypothetical protein